MEGNLTRQLLSISHLELRVTWLEAWAAQTESASVLAASLNQLLATTSAGSPGFIAARLPLVAWAVQPEHSDVAHAAWVAAQAEGQYLLDRFLSMHPRRCSAQDPKQSAAASQREPKTTSRGLTLGERKAVARGHQRHVLQRLLVDPDPAVFRVLLSNPRLSQSDLLRVVSSRKAAESQLREVFSAPRWLSSLEVRRALCLNPKTPDSAAIPLLWVLRRQDLQDVAKGRDLTPERRQHARDLLERRVPVPDYVRRDGLH